MNLGRLLRLVFQSIRRSKRDFLFSSVGIIVGISTLLFFTALGQGIKRTVLEEVFVVRQLEVVPRAVSLLRSGVKLDDAMITALQKLPGVARVSPKMKLRAPAGGSGGAALIGRDLYVELVADGIPDHQVSAEEVKAPHAFRDWEAPIACATADDAACPATHACDTTAKQCAAKTCVVDADYGGGSGYCDRAARQCRMPIPVVISPQLIELYEGALKNAVGSGGTSGALKTLANPRMLIGFTFDGTFGRSPFLGGGRGPITRRKLQLVGFSQRAIHLGVTMPLGYVKRLNAAHATGDQGGADVYDAALVETTTNDAIPHVARAITEDLNLALSERYQQAERAGVLILVITLIFNLISAIILFIAAVNIMHTFLMMILERRRELGLMRALGATRAQLRVMIACEATVLGLFGGTLGALLGAGATRAVDAIFARQVQDFPFKPQSLFLIEPWMLLLALGAALLFCWLGALWPALRAGRVDPAEALARG